MCRELVLGELGRGSLLWQPGTTLPGVSHPWRSVSSALTHAGAQRAKGKPCSLVPRAWGRGEGVAPERKLRGPA